MVTENYLEPYYYNSNCIYWHFEEARWKYFPQPAPIVVEKFVKMEVPVEVVKVEYKEVFTDNLPYDTQSKEWYRKDRLYRVEDIPQEISH